MKDYPLIIPPYLAQKGFELGEIRKEVFDNLMAGNPDWINGFWCYVNLPLKATSSK